MSEISMIVPIEGFPGYLISDAGHVLSTKRGQTIHELRQEVNNTGHKYIKLGYKKPYTKKYIHRLVAEAFIKNPENLPCINHIDGNKFNNHVSNLEWCTQQQNVDHAWRTGLSKPHPMPKGKKSSFSKLTYRQVVRIRALHSGGENCGVIARKYGVDRETISRIVRHITWKEIEETA